MLAKNYKILLIFIFILISFFIRLYFTPNIGFNTDETDVYISAKMINKNLLPCDFEQSYCNLSGVTYSYFTALFTYFFGYGEKVIRSVNVFLLFFLQIGITLFLIKLNIKKTLILIFNILLLFSTWTYGLTFYARHFAMLSLLFTFFSIFLISFFRKNTDISIFKYIILFLLGFLCILTHPLGYIILFGLIFIIFFNKELLKNKLYIFICFLLIISTYISLKYNGYIQLDGNYVNYNGGALTSNISFFEKYFWFLYYFSFQPFYIIEWINYFFLIIVILLFGLIISKKQCYKYRILFYFFIMYFSTFVIYKGNYEAIRYMHYLFPLFYVVLIIELNLNYDNKKYIIISYALLVTFSLLNIPTLKARLELDYGKDMTKLGMSEIQKVEHYYPDDKTTVDFVKNIIKDGDIVITDYQLTQKYFDNRAYGFIIRDNPENILSKSPNTIFYYNSGEYFLTKNGPLLIYDINKFLNILKQNKNKVYLITSYDLKNKFHHGWNMDFVNFLESNLNNVIYIGKDGQSKVFKF